MRVVTFHRYSTLSRGLSTLSDTIRYIFVPLWLLPLAPSQHAITVGEDDENVLHVFFFLRQAAARVGAFE